LAAAEAHDVAAIGLSGLLVKSTQVMRDNLAEMNSRGVAHNWPVVLGGAALTRAYVDDQLRAMFDGQVYYAKDAFETLELFSRFTMSKGEPGKTATSLMADAGAGTSGEVGGGGDFGASGEAGGVGQVVQPGAAGSTTMADADSNQSPDRGLALSGENVGGQISGKNMLDIAESSTTGVSTDQGQAGPASGTSRSSGRESPGQSFVPATPAPVAEPVIKQTPKGPVNQSTRSKYVQAAPTPEPPFWGSRVTRGISLSEYEGRINPRSLFVGRWGLKAGAGQRTVQQLIEQDGWPRYRALMDQVRAQGLVTAGIVHGYYPVLVEGDTLRLLDPEDKQTVLGSLDFPRQPDSKGLALTDYFAVDQVDVLGLQAVTIGPGIAQAGQELHQAGQFRQYLELTGLGAELAEALADYFHDRIRQEWGLRPGQGARYSLGYPACPDLSGRKLITQLLDVERIGLELTEGYQLDPPQSTEALIVHHPEATYFSVRRVQPEVEQ